MSTKIQKVVLMGLCCFIVVSMGAKEKGVRLKDGVLTYSAGHFLVGEPLQLGYDIFGYNYQGHMFEGSYANAYLGRDGFPPYPYDGTQEEKDAYLPANSGADATWYWPYRDVYLVMKWNDAWLANTDRDGDDKLDKHYGYTSYIGSGAWETNHMFGTNPDDTEWDYFVKIVAAPADAYKVDIDPDPVEKDEVWYTADGIEIGPDIWGQFAIIMEVVNDPGAGIEGRQYGSPVGPGFGKW